MSMDHHKRAIEIRELRGPELSVLQDMGVAIPHPHLAMARVAYDGDRIVGFAIFQLVPHTEPMWVDPEYRGGELTKQLADEITEFAKEAAGYFVCVATSPIVDKLCRDHKMEVFPGTVFVGRA